MNDPKRPGSEQAGPEGLESERLDSERLDSERLDSKSPRPETGRSAGWRPPAEPCPSRETLAAWADGDLPAAAAAALAAHLPECGVCRADLAELGAFQAEALDIAAQMDRDLAALRPDRPAQAAARDAESRRAGSHLKGEVSGTQGAASREAATEASAGPLAGLRRVLASFQAPQPLPAALRARGGAGSRGQGAGGAARNPGSGIAVQHCSFSADEGRVIISCVIRPDEETGGYRLSGRLHGLEARWVQLLDEAGRPLARAGLDAHGAFQLAGLSAGRRQLRFDGPGLVLELDRAIEIGPMEAV